MAAPEGNKYNEIYTLEKELQVFKEIIEEAKKGKYLSIQEAVMLSPYERGIFYYLCDRFKDLDNIKKELNDIIIAIVNRKGLEGAASFDEFDDPGEITISFGFGYLSANGIIL